MQLLRMDRTSIIQVSGDGGDVVVGWVGCAMVVVGGFIAFVVE